MAFRWLTILLLAAFALPASARDFEPHVSFGIKPDRSLAPTVIDMRWASGVKVGPVEGRKIRLFVLASAGLKGDGDSRELSVETRRGNERVLLFEDGRWQPLRPIRVTFGPEISFGATIGEAMPDETVGIVMSDAVDIVGVEKTVRAAMAAAPCELEALVLLLDGLQSAPTALGREFRDAFELPDLPLVRLPGMESSSNATDRQLRIGRLLALQCLELMRMKQGD